MIICQACKESCLAYNQRQQCGCMEYRFPGNDKRICNVSDLQTSKQTKPTIFFLIHGFI